MFQLQRTAVAMLAISVVMGCSVSLAEDKKPDWMKMSKKSAAIAAPAGKPTMNPNSIKAAAKMDPRALNLVSKMDARTMATMTKLSKTGGLNAISKNPKALQAMSAMNASKEQASKTKY